MGGCSDTIEDVKLPASTFVQCVAFVECFSPTASLIAVFLSELPPAKPLHTQAWPAMILVRVPT